MFPLLLLTYTELTLATHLEARTEKQFPYDKYKPWLISDIETGNCACVNIKDIMEEHFDLMMSYYGNHGIKMMRKFYKFYLQQISEENEYILKELYRLNEVNEILFFIRHL